MAGGGSFKEDSMAEKDRNQRMKEITQRLEQGVKEIFTSEMYMEYLKTMSQFHSYSFNNTLLIHLQKPDATLVAGYQAWQKKFHRQVKRGEKGIQIIAPAPIREKEEVEKIDPATLEPVLKPDGTPEMEEVEYTIPRFRITTVFDVSQTDGEPLPELATPELMGSVENYEIFMQAIRDISPVPIRFDEIESGAKGFYSSIDKEIVIQNGMSECQTMKTGIHEVTHAKLHDRDVMEEMGEKKDKLTREVEAESVAYTVCQYFGLDTSEYSFPYIAGWSSDKDMKELRTSMDTIRRVSGEFIDQMVERMQEIQREAQRHQETALFQSEQDRYGIYQLREDRDGTDYRFMGMAYLQEQGITVDGADYQFVYGDELQEGDTLEALYTKFNTDHPADYTGHSLSVSDVVVLKKDKELTAYYVDSFGYQELPEFDAQRKKLLESQIKEYPPLYLSDLTYAMEHRNADAYLDSRKLNLDCKKAIEEAIDSHFDGYHLAHEAAADVVETYGAERVSFVLACTVQHLRSDGRFSKETKEWADRFKIPENISRGMDLNADYVVTSHPAVMDGFIGLARKEMGEQEQEKQAGQIGPETKGLLVEGHFGTWHTAEVKEIAGETFFRMEHDGYGDTVAGIIVDADGKLVAEDLEHGFDDGAMEAITEYLYEKVPEPFIKQFYVVNDAYGDKAEREYQYFENLDEAIQAYHLLPNHLDKRLGMESREPVTSRMTLLKCENGIENVEDVKKASLDGKWINDEVADAYNHAQFYLDNKDTNIVYELPSMKGYFYIQTSAEGWFDYTFYDRKYRELDGGSYENTDISIQEAVEALLNEEKIMLAQCHVVCWNDFMEAVTEAGQREIQGKIEMPLTSGITEKEKALGDMSRSAIEETVLCYAQAQLEDMGLEDEVKLNAARVYGSRTRAGLYNNGSDLDVVLFYTGNIREDDFFSALHKAGMAIVGIPLDITPVSENRTYTMEEYMKNAEKYLDDKELKKLAYDIDQFLNEFDLYEYRDTVEDREENVEMIYADLVSGEAESIRKWVAEIAEGENDDLPEDVENAKKLLTRIEQAQETGRAEVMYEPEVEEAKITFYVAECMEFPVMGEYHDNLTLREAFQKYKEIPAERMNGIKGIGFRLEDGSMYDGDYELMRAGSISKDAIDLVPHYQESPLVQKAMADLEKMLAEEQQRKEPVQTEPAAEPGGQDRPGNMLQKPEASKPAGVRQSVLAALRERQAKQKAQEQQVQKEGEKTEKIAQGRRKGEPEL